MRLNALQKVVAKVFGIKGDMATAGMSYTARDAAFANWMAGAPSYTGKAVTEQTAMQVSTVWACVRILAETIGGLPLHVYQRDPATGNATKVDHQLGSVLAMAPNPDMTSVEFREAMITNLALRGNAYAEIERNARRQVVSLYPLLAESVEPKRDAGGRIVYEVREGTKTRILTQDRCWHVKGFGSSGLTGLSPVAYARQSLGMSLAAEEFQARFFANGANPSWIISIPQWLEKDQREIARRNIEKIWQGLDNAHRAAILEGGMTATAATMPLEDAQFMQLRGFSIQEICRIYRIPPHMVADLSRSTNNNIEHQGLEFVQFTLAPYLTRIESSAARWLMTPEERSRYFVRFNVDALLRADAAGRAALYSSAVQNGWMSRNEVRALENRNTIDEEGMDDFTCQSNLLPVERIFEDPPEPATAMAAPEPAPREEGAEKAFANTVNLQLPDSMKHELMQRVEFPALEDIAVGVARMNAQHKALLDRVEKTSAEQMDAINRLTGAMVGLVDIQKQNRELVIKEFTNLPGGSAHKQH